MCVSIYGSSQPTLSHYTLFQVTYISCVNSFLQHKVYLANDSYVLASETVMRVNELDAKVEMTLFKDHTFTEAFTSAPSVHLRNKVYVQVAVKEPKDFFRLNVEECWASQSPDHNDTTGLIYILLLNGLVHLFKHDCFIVKSDQCV